MSKLIVRSLRMMLFYAMRSDVVEHLAVAGQRPVVLAADGLGVVRGGAEVSSDTLHAEFVASVVGRLRALVSAGVLRVGVVVCGKRSAYIESTDPHFLAEVHKYYAELRVVDDLTVGESAQVLRIDP